MTTPTHPAQRLTLILKTTYIVLFLLYFVYINSICSLLWVAEISVVVCKTSTWLCSVMNSVINLMRGVSLGRGDKRWFCSVVCFGVAQNINVTYNWGMVFSHSWAHGHCTNWYSYLESRADLILSVGTRCRNLFRWLIKVNKMCLFVQQMYVWVDVPTRRVSFHVL